MAKFNVMLVGQTFYPELIMNFKHELMKIGSETICLTEKQEEANLVVDVSEIEPTTDLIEEVLWVLQTAQNLQRYEKKRRRIIKKHKERLLVASSNLINRKNIN